MLVRLARAGLVPAGVTNATQLTAAQKAQISKALGAVSGNPQAPNTWGEAIAACFGDENADGKPDLDLDTLLETGLFTGLDATALSKVLAAHTTEALQPADTAVISGADDFVASATAAVKWLRGSQMVASVPGATYSQIVDASSFESSLPPYHLTADGQLVAGPTQDPTDVAIQGIAFAANGRNNVLQLYTSNGPQRFQLRGNGSTDPTKLTTTDVMTLLDAALNQFPPITPDTKLAARIGFLRANQAFLAQPTAPADEAQAVVWRAGRVNPNDEKTIALLEQARLGLRPRHWSGYVDDLREVGVAQTVLDAARSQKNLSPAFLYTIAIGEGMNGYLDFASNPEKVNAGESVSGFGHIGLDQFVAMVPTLREKGFLKPDFVEGNQYTASEPIDNELGQPTASADFKDLPSSMTALAAVLSLTRDQFLNDVEKVLGPAALASLTEEQTNFFTYVYFNAGPGFGLRRVKNEGLDYFSPQTDPENIMNARNNALIRVETANVIQKLNIFPPA